jgi:cellobiose phosphorylase
MVAGKDAATPGEGKNSWLTGTAAWTFTTISQYILGIQPTFGGLKVDPCIPSDLKGFNCNRSFRGSVYHISVDNSAGVQKGIKEMTVNGEPVGSNVIPLPSREGEFFVNVVMG